MSSWFSLTSPVDTLIKEAVTEAIPGGEIDFNKGFEIVDLLKTKKIKARDFLRSWESRVVNLKNPVSQIKLLNLIDLCIKNAGINFSLEIFAGSNSAPGDNDFISSYGTKQNQFLNKLLVMLHNSQTSKDVKDKILELIETWHILFSENANLNTNIKSVYKTLKDEKFQFPEVKDRPFLNDKFLESKVPPAWVDSDACMIGFETFTMINRKHHCRNCGGVFCQAHSSHNIPIPAIGLSDPVRVCDLCYTQLQKPKKALPVLADEEDEMLKKALMLSLKESENHQKVMQKDPEEEDEELRAAIEASLKEMKDNTGTKQHSNVEPESVQALSAQYEPLLQHELNSKITSSEEESIYLFSQLMQNLKQQQAGGLQVAQNEELLALYGEMTKLKTKLGRSLNEDLGKYEQYVDMQAKISTVVRLYDSLLEKRLSMRGLNRQGYGYTQNMGTNYGYQSGISADYTGAPIPQSFTGQARAPQYTGAPIPQNYTGAPIPQNYTGQAGAAPQYTGTAVAPTVAPTGTSTGANAIAQHYTGAPSVAQNYTGNTHFIHNPYTEYSRQSLGLYPEASSDPQNVPSVPVDVPSVPVDVPSAPADVPSAPADVPSAPVDVSIQAPSEPPESEPHVIGQQAGSGGSQGVARNLTAQKTVDYDGYAKMFPSAPTYNIQPENPQKEEAMLIEL